ncbi:MAG TPA: glycosyltransferase family 2 protein [Xanthomonadales bacterium]|nr:glycosyltransferase family 2 protein [Xanthomonadales bacterium]
MSAVVFWSAFALVAFAYLGYPALVIALARVRGREPVRADEFPALDIVVAAHDEAARIGARIRNLLDADYPAPLRVIVVDDGSSDGTDEVAKAIGDARVTVLRQPQARGKAAALTRAIAHVTAPIVVFADARQRFARDALRRLVAPFADAAVGAVSGELMIATDDSDEPAAARTGLYWRYEKAIREAEARLGIAHGATGAIYAVRREHFRPLPEGTILDDMWTPLNAVRAGQQVWVERSAIAWDSGSAQARQEFRRKLRTLAGNWQLLRYAPWLASPRSNPVFGAWLCHKLLRLLVPWALLAMVVASALGQGPFWNTLLVLQLAFYAGGAVAVFAPRLARPVPLAGLAGTFVVLNAAALLALPAFTFGDGARLWRRG